MAWPKLRKGKSPAPLVMITERNGLGQGRPRQPRNGAQSVSTPPSAAATPEQDGPPAWPGVPTQRQEPEARAEPVASVPVAEPAAESAPADASFWDWNPDDDSEDMRFSIDDEPAASAANPGVHVVEGTIVDGPVVADPVAYGSPAQEEPVSVFTEEPTARVEGIGHRLGPLDHIFGHSRMGIWRRRVVITVALAIVISIFVNWQIGVTLAVIFAIADTVFRSRNRVVASPLPGIKLTRAQRQTQNQLNALDKSGYRALHSRLIPESEDHIDHLVIGPAGVFSIDSEYWDKHLPIRTKNARQLWHGPFSMKDRLEHAHWEADQASELLTRAASPQLLARMPGGKVSVRPAMAVYGPKIPWDVATIRDVDVFKGGRLRTYLRRYARQNDARPLDATEIEELHTAAHNAFPHLNPGILAPQPA
jgi:hypothetical protein